MHKLNTSLICTIYNEESTVEKLIDSIALQTVLPDEVILVDGGSNDDTREIIKKCIRKYSQINIKLFVKKGNRSVGRNEAVRKSNYEIILSTDAGGYLDRHWVENITKPFLNSNIDVVAGYYKGTHTSIFQKSLIPYVLVMQDRVVPNNFLPATRSMAFKKHVWTKIGGFNKKLSHNEDYDFANRVKNGNFKIKFEQSAVAYWIPRNNITEAFKMFLRFAYGDAESFLLRDKVVYIFLRYLFALYLVILTIIMKSTLLSLTVGIFFASYVIWSVYKNYKYVQEIKAVYYLPLLQFTSDIAVLIGTTFGFVKNIKYKKIIDAFVNNKGLTLILLAYVSLMITMINWGIPNLSHPFNYFMDEWHQLQSVRNLFVFGSPNIEGSANGSVFHFLVSGILLIPFYFVGVIDPFSINSSVGNLLEQHRLFEVLRLNTLLFGVLSIIVFYYISKKHFKLNPVISTYVFVFNPVWIMLSNYFKYDIALMFWTLLAFAFMLRYIQKPIFLNLLLASVFSSISLSVKLQPFALPLLLILIFFFFTPKFLEKLRWIIIALFVYVFVFIFLGIPDILLSKGNLYEYLSSNLIRTPSYSASNLMINKSIWEFLILNIYPTLFGFSLFIVGGLYGVFVFVKQLILLVKNRTIDIGSKQSLFITTAFALFVLTLVPLKLEATNNRALVLLPFFAIFFGLFWQKVLSLGFSKKLVTTLILILLLLQTLQAAAWVKIKYDDNPRQTSSEWIINNLSTGSTIGIESIPIYQFLPDIVLKEFYEKMHNQSNNHNFKYVVYKNFVPEAEYIILTNSNLENLYFKNTDKANVVKGLKIKGYREVNSFSSDFSLLKYFSSDLEYYIAGIVQSPLEIKIYEKTN